MLTNGKLVIMFLKTTLRPLTNDSTVLTLDSLKTEDSLKTQGETTCLDPVRRPCFDRQLVVLFSWSDS